MYALLDFGDLRIEQRTKYSKVKSYYKAKIVYGYEEYCDINYIESIDKFFQGIILEEAFYQCKTLNKVIIPSSVTSIGESAFQGCSSLTSVEITDSVTCIGDGAFYLCTSLNNVTISEGVTSIGDYAFFKCNFINIEIPLSVTKIGMSAFFKVPHIYYNGSATGSPWGALAMN